MALRTEYEFIRAHGGTQYHKDQNPEITNEGRVARRAFVDFCDNAFLRADLGWNAGFASRSTNWQQAGNIYNFVWKYFKHADKINNRVGGKASVSLLMEAFADEGVDGVNTVKLVVRFELDLNGMDDEEALNRFNDTAQRNLGIEGLMYAVLTRDGIHRNIREEVGTLEEAMAQLEELNGNARICPTFVIAMNEEFNADENDDELINRAANAIGELNTYYNIFLSGLNEEAAAAEEAGETEDAERENDNVRDARPDHKNVILYGPPGTGKTYSTVLRALDIFGVHYADYGNAKILYDGFVEDGRIKFVTFHQSYGYEEFIEGIRPSTDDEGRIRYEVRPGVFKCFCDDARGKISENGSDLPYVFIIDEINRGNISKIFGELITLIEDNKREGEREAAKAVLPYSGDDFSVPRNVYIIGTMNTADRSITSLDTALRRRFRFEEMMPRSELLDGIEVDGVNIRDMLDAMNRRIEVLYDREHRIGHAYFLCLRDDPSMDNLADVFGNEIIPLLQEYFFDDYGKIRVVLGDNRTPDWGAQFFTEEETDVEDLLGPGVEGDVAMAYTRNDEALRNSAAYRKIYM